MRTRPLVLAAAAVAALALAACAPEEIASPTVTVTSSPEAHRTLPAPPPEDPIPAVAWPLTGEPALDVSAEDLTRPIVAVKIENTADARPHTNLHLADVVYETYVEAGISRFIALYHSHYPDEVGPIRSLRPMDWNIVGQYQGPLVFSGGQWRFMNSARNAGQIVLAQDLGSDGFFRVPIRRSPHNLHGSIPEFASQSGDAQATRFDVGFAYPSEIATAVSGTPATHIEIYQSRYAQPSWDWDAESGTWLRNEYDDPHMTTEDVRISATNVMVLRVVVQENINIPETLVNGRSGTGFLATGGAYVPINWSKSSRTDFFNITDADGNPIGLAPGQTWIHLLPESGYATKGTVEFS